MLLTINEFDYIKTKVIPGLITNFDGDDEDKIEATREFSAIFTTYAEFMSLSLLLTISRFYYRATYDYRESCPEDLKKLLHLVDKMGFENKWREEFLHQWENEYGTAYADLCKRVGIDPSVKQ